MAWTSTVCTPIEAVLQYLDKNDPEAARRARYRYACFDHFGTDPQNYGFATTVKGIEPCEDAVVQQLVDLRRKHAELISCDGRLAEEEFFSAEQKANCECRALLPGDVSRASLVLESARRAHVRNA